MADAPLENRLELGVAARNGIADDHEIERFIDLLGLVTLEHRNVFRRQKVAHRRIHVLVGSANLVTAMLEQRRKGRHRRAADANQMDAHHSTTASSITSAGRGPVTTRPRTPNGIVQVAPTVWPDGNPNTTGP